MTRIHHIFLVSILFAVLLVGCSKASGPDVEDPSANEGETAEEQAQEGTVTLGFVGDVCLADNYIPMQYLESLGSTDITDGIDPRFIDQMKSVDIMWVNNEFAYGTDVEPLPGKEYTFLAAPENVTYLKDMGVDIVGLANNHVFDYGEDAFMQTLETLEGAGISYVGAGRNIQQASAPVVIEVNGVKVAYVAASSAEYTVYTPEAGEDEPGIMWCYDDTQFLAAIGEAAQQADFVVALPHWGVEHSTELDAKQIESSRAYIDAGADIVVGTHSHILQGIDYHNGKPILYNLGNFWFDGYDIDTVMVKLIVTAEDESDPDVRVMLLPGTQSGAFTSMAPDMVERNRIFRYIEQISPGAVVIDGNGYVSEG